MLSHVQACGKIPRHARLSVHQAGTAWHRFLEIWDAIESLDGNLLAEDFAAFFARFRQLQRLGVPFDLHFVRQIEAIAQCCRNTEDDPDADGHDEKLTDADPGDPDDFTPGGFSRLTIADISPSSQSPLLRRQWDYEQNGISAHL